MISEGRALEPDALRDTPEGELQGFLKHRGLEKALGANPWSWRYTANVVRGETPIFEFKGRD